MVLASAATVQAVPLSGRVFDQTGAVLPGVAVDVVAGDSRLTAASDGEGRYVFESIPPGVAELTYRLLNFSVARRTVRVTSASFVVPDVVLALSLNADVVVTGSRTFRNMFVGDAGTTEAGRPSRRHGIEWASYARVRDWLTVDGELAFSRAQFRDGDPAGRSIPGSVDRVISAGLTLQPRGFVAGSLRVRSVGPRPLVEDARASSPSSTLWNGELGYPVSNRTRLVFECFNIFNAKTSDVEYFYTSRLPGESAAGVDDIHLHPNVPRTVRLGIQVTF